jgi:hypothetical protein
MKKKNLLPALLILFAGTVLWSCATVTITDQEFSERWKKTEIGMSLEEFKLIWPEAEYNGIGPIPNATERWTFREKNLLGYIQRSASFSFQDGLLINKVTF